jgi:hypothetical protein
MLAHIGGLPVEELAAQLLAAGAGFGLWLATRVRGRARR